MLISETQISGCVFISQQFLDRLIPHLAPKTKCSFFSRDQAFKEKIYILIKKHYNSTLYSHSNALYLNVLVGMLPKIHMFSL